MKKNRTRFWNFANYLIMLLIWSACGSIHYLLSSFASLSIDFRDWHGDARWIFAGLGIGAMLLGNILYIAELFDVVPSENTKDEEE